ncbi:NADP-dependent oxidoreductase domain-containing protein [Chlamydoabsidia padenii]|nr:NADP-dependent oxidoreductase domain-containing protein [Chlamydoabsidia padenii]
MSDASKMQYVRFGNTGLMVSRLCLGCMGYGSSEWQDWVLNEKESVELIGKAYQKGINFFDTADVYSNGESERVLGKAIKQFNMSRGRIVVATKATFAVLPTPAHGLHRTPFGDPNHINEVGASRKHLFDAIDASLERLGLDYIDLYQVHRFVDFVPLEETMRALHDIVQSGKVRYIGASSLPAWQFQKANQIAEKNGWTKFVSMQNLYNLLYREEEREMIPYCLDSGVALIPWAPLAGGLLARKRDTTDTTRSITTAYRAKQLYRAREDSDNDIIVDQVATIAEKRGVTPAQVAIAWLLSKPVTTSPIVGAQKENHLDDLLAGMELKLTPEEIEALETHYYPRLLMNYV